MSYYSLDDIIASEKRINVRATHDMPTYMFDGACSVQGTQDDLEESQTNESASFNQSVSTLDTSMNQECKSCHMPVWLALHFHETGRGLARREAVFAPKEYLTRTRSALSINPRIGDLHKLGPYYYMVGEHLINLAAIPQTGNIAAALLHMYRLRAIWIQSEGYHGDEAPPILDVSESELHMVARQSRHKSNLFNAGLARQVID